ncbi:MAG TPA: hypothetical protein VF021_12695, partial [Longimicrobiales bacterium]
MNRRTQIYLFAIIAAAAFILPLQDWHAVAVMTREEFLGVLVLIIMALVTNALTVSATVGSHQASSSIAFLPYFAAVLLFPSSAVAAVVCVTALATQLLVHKQNLLKAAFNSAQSTIAIIVACNVFEGLGGRHTPELLSNMLHLANIGSFAALA